MDNHGYDMWAEERAEERSLTWKERHAKGVPVKLAPHDTAKWYEFSHVDGNANYYYTYDRHTMEPVIWISEENDYPGPTGPDAIFCNFRYKPEWLAKKSGHAHDANVTSMDRDELWNSPPIGGFKD